MQFASDNWAGASEPIMQALLRHNEGFAPAYGGDDLTKSVEDSFASIFETDCKVWFTATGTGANALALSTTTGPGGVVFCHQDAHIRVDECGSIEFMQPGSRIWGLDGSLGKITPDRLKTEMELLPEGVARHGIPSALSITQATEVGTVYSLDEIKDLSNAAKSRNMALHMDGARFANALVHLDTSPAEMTWKAGVDILSFGATKNGAYCAEAVVFFNSDYGQDFEACRLRAGHHMSKMRFVASQFEGYFANDHWLDNARHANNMASTLIAGLEASPNGRPTWESQSNEVFAIVKKSSAAMAKEQGATFHEWPDAGLPPEHQPQEDECMVRLVCSYLTSEQDVAGFLDAIDN